MARPRAFDKSEALLQAMRVFWTHGYEGTSLAALLAATGLSKSSLYATFGNKRALFLAAFEAYRDERRRHLHEVLAAGPTARAALEAFFHKVLGHARDGETPFGCMTCNEAVELGPHDLAIQALVQSDFQSIEDAFTAVLARGALDGSLAPPPPGCREADRARLLVVHLLGLHTLTRANAAPSLLEGSVAAVLAFLAPPP